MSEDHGIDDHLPDPEFVARLEWQLRSEMRRDREFAASSARRGRLRAAALVVISLALGFATATAAQQLGDRSRARYLRMEAEGRLELAEMRLMLVSEMTEDMARGPEPDNVEAMRWELEQARMDRDRAALQLEEIDTGGVEPRDDLTAPLVGGRDFVSERLELDLARTEMLQRMLDLEADQDEANRDAYRAELEPLAKQRNRTVTELELRERFLSGQLTGEQILHRQRDTRARESLARAELRVQEITRWQRQAQARQQRGDADQVEVRMAEYELAAARLELRLARFELRLPDNEKVPEAVRERQ